MTTGMPETRREWIATAVVAGLAGAAALAVFAAINQRLGGSAITGTYRFLAVELAGPAAVGAPWAVPVGALVLVLGAVGWSIAYMQTAQRQPQLLTRPVISGLLFGVIVWFVMLLVRLPFDHFQGTSLGTLDRDLFGFTVFFGLPMALVAARLTRAR